MTTIREKLTALYNVARDGGNVDAAELVALETQVQAEDTIQALAEEGAVARAAEKATREHQARKATAAATARDTMHAARTALTAADQALRAAITTYADAIDQHNTAVHDAISTLTAAGYPSHYESSHLAKPVDHPDYDEHLLPIHASNCEAVQIDGTRHQAIDAGHGVLWSVSREPRAWSWIGQWRRQRDTHPICPPIPGIDTGLESHY